MRSRFGLIVLMTLSLCGWSCTPPQDQAPAPQTYQCFKTCRNEQNVVVDSRNGTVEANSQGEAQTSFDAANPCPESTATQQLSCQLQDD